jgi:hypothetical protein
MTRRNSNRFRHVGPEVGANHLEAGQDLTHQGQDQDHIQDQDLIRHIPRDLDPHQYQDEKDPLAFLIEEESQALVNDPSHIIGRLPARPRRTVAGQAKAGAGAEAAVEVEAGAEVRGINNPGHAADLSLHEKTFPVPDLVICPRSSHLS